VAPESRLLLAELVTLTEPTLPLPVLLVPAEAVNAAAAAMPFGSVMLTVNEAAALRVGWIS
jgi:hypothetical protein